jgi:hypothetical protein
VLEKITGRQVSARAEQSLVFGFKNFKRVNQDNLKHTRSKNNESQQYIETRKMVEQEFEAETLPIRDVLELIYYVPQNFRPFRLLKIYD